MALTFLNSSFVTWTLLSMILLFVLGQAAYRRWMHPLRKYPGPWLNSISPLPSALVTFRGVQHTYHYRLHEKYGPVVRISPDELSFTELDAWEQIYGYRHGNAMEKSRIFIGVVSPMNGCVGIGLARGSEHARQRRALAVGFTKNAIVAQQEIIEGHVSKLIEVLKCGKAFDMSKWYSYTTFDMIGDICFGKSFGCLDQGSATEWALAVSNVLVSATWDMGIRRVTGINTLLHRLVLRFMPADVMKWRKITMSNAREKTIERLADEESSHKDVVYHIQRNSDARKSLAPTELLLNMSLLLTAGSETTSILLTTLTYALCTHHDIYQRLATMVRTTFPDPSDITFPKLEELVYLDACIKEAMRVFPPASSNLLRVTPPNGAQIGEHKLPSGLTVSVASWAAARSAVNFHLPNEYRPERWLCDHPDQGWDPVFGNDNLSASAPFGVGPKGCLGQNLAYYETRMIMVHLLWAFDFELETKGVLGEQNRK